MLRVNIKPSLLSWSLERSGRALDELPGKLPELVPSWLTGEVRPTLKQLEAYANAVRVPIGYLFLPKPPDEALPIPDLRTFGSEGLKRVSPDLLDTIYLCLRRQAWYRDFARSTSEDKRTFIGSVSLNSNVERTAAVIRRELGFDLVERRRFPTWTDALRHFIAQAEAAGVLVMVNGVVGSNNTRKLDPGEFRGFALVDEYAPLVFINGADTRAAQMFTLAHELAHLWLGESALSDVAPYVTPGERIERWCNSVAAEILVPMEDFVRELPAGDPVEAKQKLAHMYKVSTLVILRRLFDAGRLTFDGYRDAYEAERAFLMERVKSGGGNFYLTQEVRTSRRFVKALVVSTLEGQTLYTDAFRLLGIKKVATFEAFGQRMGVA